MLREILQSIKEIIVDYVKSRLFPVTVVVLVLFSILVHQLFVLQIKEGEEHMENFVYKSKKTLTIDSVRGNIYDCNGNLLAYNELSYSVVFSNDNAQTTMAKNLKISENELKNQIVDETISILEKNGDSLTLDFPIKLDANGNFQFTVKDQQLKNFLKDVYAKTDYDSMPDEQKNATAAMQRLQSMQMSFRACLSPSNPCAATTTPNISPMSSAISVPFPMRK